jgi:phosphate transport system ATP-binding protein
MAASFEISNLSAWYGNRIAIEDISLSVEPNQVTALIGPSGCGKSTLVRCLNRLHELVPGARADGKVILDGENIYDEGVDAVSVRRSVGMVFQRPNPFPTMSILDNTIAGFKLNGRKPKAELEEIVERALTGAGLWDEVKDRLSSAATSLSGGQQQRLCIARAIAVQPEILLMDEPCSALDPVATLRIEDLIMELRERYTIVLVTHNMQQAARVADRTAFLLGELAGDPGRLIEIGPTKKIFTQPEDKRTEGYITGRFG